MVSDLSETLSNTKESALLRDQRIIGGMFGLEEPKQARATNPCFVTHSSLFLVNARSCIALLVDRLSPKKVWLPSYLCDSIIAGLGKSEVEVTFYEVDYDLRIASSNWSDDVQPNELVVLIDYFGFTYDDLLASKIKANGAWILEDACQALLSDVGRFSDFVLFSPRKFVGVPDGGILVVNCDVGLREVVFTPPPSQWWLDALAASLLRREYDTCGTICAWFDLFQKSESTCPVGPYSMSELSKSLLFHSVDYSFVAERRIENYLLLSDELRELAILPELTSGVVPLGFPIRVKNRDRIRETLFGCRVYPPVHWPIDGIVPDRFSDSHRLSAEIMTLPVDQRYDAEDIQRMSRVVRRSVSR